MNPPWECLQNEPFAISDRKSESKFLDCNALSSLGDVFGRPFSSISELWIPCANAPQRVKRNTHESHEKGLGSGIFSLEYANKNILLSIILSVKDFCVQTYDHQGRFGGNRVPYSISPKRHASGGPCQVPGD